MKKGSDLVNLRNDNESPAWPINYLGDQWIAGEHDCWGFARRVWREVFGWQVPIIDVDALSTRSCIQAFHQNPERNHWTAIVVPQEGAAVAMSQGKHVTHIGIWTNLDNGGVVHCLKDIGVVFSSKYNLILLNWKIKGYYLRTNLDN